MITTMTWSSSGTQPSGGPGTYSRAPRSAYGTGPRPAFAVDGSSIRDLPAASVAGQNGWLELASSIAGEPHVRRRSPFPRVGEAGIRLDRPGVVTGRGRERG